MEKMIDLFEEYLNKTILETEKILSLTSNDVAELEIFIQNRDRLLKIVNKISLEIQWNNVDELKREELNRTINFIKKLDEKLIVKLQETRESLRREIELTFKQKENIKGYNLNHNK